MLQVNDFTKKTINSYFDKSIKIINFIDQDYGIPNSKCLELHIQYLNTTLYIYLWIGAKDQLSVDELVSFAQDKIVRFSDILIGNDTNALIDFVLDGLKGRYGLNFFDDLYMQGGWDVVLQELNQYMVNLPELNNNKSDFFTAYCKGIEFRDLLLKKYPYKVAYDSL